MLVYLEVFGRSGKRLRSLNIISAERGSRRFFSEDSEEFEKILEITFLCGRSMELFFIRSI